MTTKSINPVLFLRSILRVRQPVKVNGNVVLFIFVMINVTLLRRLQGYVRVCVVHTCAFIQILSGHLNKS